MIEKKKKNYLGSQYSALPLVSAVDDFISRQHPLAVASTARQEDVSLQASSSFVLRASEIQLSSFVWINIYIYILKEAKLPNFSPWLAKSLILLV
jgi:hypothetical protein